MMNPVRPRDIGFPGIDYLLKMSHQLRDSDSRILCSLTNSPYRNPDGSCRLNSVALDHSVRIGYDHTVGLFVIIDGLLDWASARGKQ